MVGNVIEHIADDSGSIDECEVAVSNQCKVGDECFELFAVAA